MWDLALVLCTFTRSPLRSDLRSGLALLVICCVSISLRSDYSFLKLHSIQLVLMGRVQPSQLALTASLSPPNLAVSHSCFIRIGALLGYMFLLWVDCAAAGWSLGSSVR